MIGEANILYVENKLQDARALLYEVIRRDSHIPEAYLLCATIEFEHGNDEEALDLLLVRAQRQPEHIGDHLTPETLRLELLDELAPGHSRPPLGRVLEHDGGEALA